MIKFANTNYGRKILFEKILSKDLATYAFVIDAFYESAARSQIMSIHITDDRTVHLGINISFGAEDVFADCSEAGSFLSLAFRAYFITNYLHCLQEAKEAVPCSFFSGLVILESIFDLNSGRKLAVYMPDAVRKNKNLRPIEVHCAVRAMTRILIENGSLVSDKAKGLCEAYTDTLVAYTGAPEVEYLKSKHARYTVLCETEALKEMLSQHPGISGEYALFRQVGMLSADGCNLGELLSACDTNENRFWPAMILRLLSLTQNYKAVQGYMKFACMQNAGLDFCSNSLESYYQKKRQSVLINDTLQAVLHLAGCVERSGICGRGPASGMVHYIR